MNKNSTFILSVIALLALVVLKDALFIVDETKQVIITQFGKPVGKPIKNPGIHIKIPFIQTPNYFEKRFLEWDGSPNQVPTRDKRFIWVDTYARWRIIDPLLFFQRLRDERGAQSRLDDILDGETRNAIAKHDLVELIRSTNRVSVYDEETETGGDSTEFVKISYGREKITKSILENAAPLLRELGIELLDLRFKRINYVEEVQKKIFERMISERKRIAEKYRSEGEGEASKILGDKERDLKMIQSEAYRKAQEIIGKADSEATAIYASAYNKNKETRDFYQFLKTMETYKNTIAEKDWLFLSTKGEFLKYLQNMENP
ncbi:MAG: protease modulator HflC [Chitinispirillaceae bacterium]|nr:protease modulator HflC [Chitinispirillaceae bacterium]